MTTATIPTTVPAAGRYLVGTREYRVTHTPTGRCRIQRAWQRRDGEAVLGPVVAAGPLTTTPRIWADHEHVNRLLADPAEHARAYAQATGRCARCGRVLTHPQSVRVGLGPECQRQVIA